MGGRPSIHLAVSASTTQENPRDRSRATGERSRRPAWWSEPDRLEARSLRDVVPLPADRPDLDVDPWPRLVLAAAINLAAGGGLLTGERLLLLPLAAALMLFIGLVAAFGPARHRLAVQPTEALREE